MKFISGVFNGRLASIDLYISHKKFVSLTARNPGVRTKGQSVDFLDLMRFSHPGHSLWLVTRSLGRIAVFFACAYQKNRYQGLIRRASSVCFGYSDGHQNQHDHSIDVGRVSHLLCVSALISSDFVYLSSMSAAGSER